MRAARSPDEVSGLDAKDAALDAGDDASPEEAPEALTASLRASGSDTTPRAMALGTCVARSAMKASTQHDGKPRMVPIRRC